MGLTQRQTGAKKRRLDSLAPQETHNPRLAWHAGGCGYLGSGTEVIAVVFAALSASPYLLKLLATAAGGGHVAAAGVVAAAMAATITMAAFPAAAFTMAPIMAPVAAAALTAAALLATTARLGFASRGHGGTGGGGTARSGLRTAVATIVAAAVAMAPLTAAALTMAPLTAASLTATAIVTTAGRGCVAAAGATAEQLERIDGRRDTQQTGSQGRHESTIHCKTPQERNTRRRKRKHRVAGTAGPAMFS
jgi:hypothetical protein